MKSRSTFLPIIFFLMDVLLEPVSCSWKESHLVKLGTKLKVNCPHTFQNLSVEWEKENHDGTSQIISKLETLEIDKVGLKDSGTYSCFENVLSDGEEKFEHHKTQILVVDYHCTPIEGDSSKNLKCSINYESDDGSKVQVYRLCKPLTTNHGELVETQDRADGLVIHHEMIVEKEKQDCIFMIKFLNSALRLWPGSYVGGGQSCPEMSSQSIESAVTMDWTSPQFLLNVMAPILSNCVIVVLTVILSCMVIITNKKSKAKINYTPNTGEYLSSFKPPVRHLKPPVRCMGLPIRCHEPLARCPKRPIHTKEGLQSTPLSQERFKLPKVQPRD